MKNNTKEALREYCIKMRRSIGKDLKTQYDSFITYNLVNNEFFKNAEFVLCYCSTDKEIDTFSVINRSFELCKRVFVPKCCDEKGVMNFYEIKSLSELSAGKYGILEPASNELNDFFNSFNGQEAICIVPSLCADSKGYRVGYGGGYYDRFLKKFSGKSVCLCYKDFYPIDFEHGKYDVPCDIVITN